MLPVTAMQKHPFMQCDTYASKDVTPGVISRLWPSFSFYFQLFFPLSDLCLTPIVAPQNKTRWIENSAAVIHIFENIGCPVYIEGMQYIMQTKEPCVFVANHMSTLETFVLPSIIYARRPMTFVVKDSLIKMAWFGRALRARNPIVVKRVNPREDLQTVLSEGCKRLEEGISVVVFPQSTRSTTFDPQHFNSIGIKLAKRANVPVVPIALRTDAWSTGSLIKDFGKIHIRPIHFAFGAPLRIESQGKQEQQQIVAFIQNHLQQWAD